MQPNNHFKDRKPQYWERMTKKQRGVFSFVPLITPLLIIVIAIGIYFLIITYNLFPDFQIYLYYALKIIIAFEILAASARTLWAPILGVIMGVGLYFAEQFFNLVNVAGSDAVQLMIISGVGFLIILIVKLL